MAAKQSPQGAAKLKVSGWILYDFANTIFSAVVLTFYFPRYLTGLAQKNFPLGLATTAAMVLAGFSVPAFGALSDRTGRTKSYLIQTTLLCILFTASLSFFTSIPLLILIFLIACFFFHASLVFYNALLPAVAEPGREGFVSGLGTALGYLGVVFSIPIAHLIQSVYGLRVVFFVAAALFLIFSLPLFFWVPERSRKTPERLSFALISGSWKDVFERVRSLAGKKDSLYFFLGNFFLMETINAVIFWLIVYIARVFQPSESILVFIFLGLNFSAFLSGLLLARITDRWGSQKTLLAAAVSLFLTVFFLSFTRSLGAFVAVSFVGGSFAFAGMWTAGRKRVLELAPPARVGEYFGLYNLTTKISVVWSLIFSILSDGLGFRIALASLMIPSGLGCLFLWRSRQRAQPP